ncbi:MAG TPA: CoA-transferase, partial [Pyrinomonadaceae bacterium]|nr:CoA-transferase [Pyrinomonadaceae bacterium]
QIDRFGNLNTTVIGNYANPAVRLPGSGGACEIASLAKRVLVITPQSKRSFPEKVDFVTSPGFIDGPGSRSKLGLKGGGPAMVITDLGCYEFEDEEMILTSLHPGRTLEEVKNNTGWEVRVSSKLKTTHEPTSEELRIISDELDPTHLYI